MLAKARRESYRLAYRRIEKTRPAVVALALDGRELTPISLP